MATMDKSQVDISAILNTYTYLDTQKAGFAGKSLEFAIKQIDSNKESFMRELNITDPKEQKEYLECLETVKNAMEANPELKNLRIREQSTIRHERDLLIANAFEDENGNVYVAYRGTGEGKWIDNGEGMVKESTVMQEEAALFFEEVIKNGADGQVIVTGHSKGGNLAQYVTLKNPDMVDVCYSIDGQGFSSSAINGFVEDLGLEKYKETLQKMYSINGENDFVHDLGHVIIPEENTYFIKTPDADGPEGWHSIVYMITSAELNWFTDEDGNITHGEQGLVGKIAKRLSEEFMELPEEKLYDAAITIMYAAEIFLNDRITEGTGTVKKPTIEEIFGGISVVLPLLAKEFVEWGATVISNEVNELLTKIKDTPVYSMLVAVGSWATEKYKQAVAWAKNNLNPGRIYAKANSYIKVDTNKLRDYAARLNKVNKRIEALDRAMDSLYRQVGFLDLLDLIHADILTGHSWRISRCANYLTNTAGDFENAERKINNKL